MSNFIKFSKLTKEQYQGLTPDPSTLYLIIDNNQICFGDSLKTADTSAITGIVHAVIDPSTGTPGGFATLNAEGKVPSDQISVISSRSFKGLWDASAGIAPSENPETGQYWICNNPGIFQGVEYGNGDEINCIATSPSVQWGKVSMTEFVRSVNTKKGDVTITKSDINLGNVDNTADIDKPMSTATKTYIDDSLSHKADSSTTLAGYGITDAYTKAYIDTSIGNLTTSVAEKASTTYVDSAITDLNTSVNTAINNIDASIENLTTSVAEKASTTYVDSAITDLNTSVNTAINNIDASIENLTTSVAEKASTTYVNTAVSDLNTSVNTAINNIDASIENLTTSVAEKASTTYVNTVVSDLNTSVNTAVDNINTSINNLNTSVNTAINNIDASIENLTTSVAEKASTTYVNTVVSDLNTSVNTAVGTINTSISTINTSIGNLTTSVAEKASISYVDTAIVTLNTSVNTAVDNINTSINNLNTSVNAAINNIDASIENLTTSVAEKASTTYVNTAISDLNTSVNTAMSAKLDKLTASTNITIDDLNNISATDTNDTFIATYGVTTYANCLTAVNAKKAVVVEYWGITYYLKQYDSVNNIIYFKSDEWYESINQEGGYHKYLVQKGLKITRDVAANNGWAEDPKLYHIISIIDNLTTSASNNSLSAKLGKELKTLVDGKLSTAIDFTTSETSTITLTNEGKFKYIECGTVTTLTINIPATPQLSHYVRFTAGASGATVSTSLVWCSEVPTFEANKTYLLEIIGKYVSLKATESPAV